MAPLSAANDNMPAITKAWTDKELRITRDQCDILAGRPGHPSEARSHITSLSLERRKMLHWMPAGKPGEYKLVASPKGKAALDRYHGKAVA